MRKTTFGSVMCFLGIAWVMAMAMPSVCMPWASTGEIELATDTETKALTATDRAVTPGNLGALNASTTQEGILETATNTETQNLTATDKAVTPSNLGALNASTTQEGLIKIASDGEVQDGTATTLAVSPAGMQACTATEARAGVLETATNIEAAALTATDKAVVPSNLEDMAFMDSGAANITGGTIAIVDGAISLTHSYNSATLFNVENVDPGTGAYAGYYATVLGATASFGSYGSGRSYAHFASRSGITTSTGDGLVFGAYNGTIDFFTGSLDATDLVFRVDSGGLIIGNETVGGTLALYATSEPTPLTSSAELWVDSTSGQLTANIADSSANVYTANVLDRYVEIEIDAYNVQTATGENQGIVTIPYPLNGWSLADAEATVYTPGTAAAADTLDVTLRRKRATTEVEMLLWPVTVASAAYSARDGVINTSNDDVATGDVIAINVDQIHATTANYGLWVTLTFRPF